MYLVAFCRYINHNLYSSLEFLFRLDRDREINAKIGSDWKKKKLKIELIFFQLIYHSGQFVLRFRLIVWISLIIEEGRKRRRIGKKYVVYYRLFRRCSHPVERKTEGDSVICHFFFPRNWRLKSLCTEMRTGGRGMEKKVDGARR